MRTPLHPFRPRLLDALRGYDRGRLAADIGAGVTVGIVALPLALAFAIASGVKPEQGLVAAIVGGFLIAALGGSQVQIGGPAGAFVVVVYAIVERHGMANLLVATAAAGVLLFLLGWFRLGAVIRYLPLPIVVGFTSAIAVLIALSQLRDLLGLTIDKMPGDTVAQVQVLARHLDGVNPAAVALAVACVAILVGWSRLATAGEGRGQRARDLARRLPAPIVAMVTLTLLAHVLALPVETIASRFGELPRDLPSLSLPSLTWAGLQQLTTPIVTLALLGAIESLLCARVADNLGDFRRHDPNQELMAQGIANIVVPLLGGIPVTGTIARTVTNVRAGATSPVAGIVHALTLLVVLLAAAPLAGHVPLAVLAGILLFVAWNMFERHQFARLRHFSSRYRVLMLGTFVLTIVFDLSVAVEVGLVAACVFFIWRMGTLFGVRAVEGAVPPPAGVHVAALYGSLFFGAVGKVDDLADALPAGTRALVLDMHRLVSMDSSGLDALQQLHRTLRRQGVALWLAGVNDQPLALARRAGFERELGPDAVAATLAAAVERAGRHAGAAASPATAPA